MHVPSVLCCAATIGPALCSVGVVPGVGVRTRLNDADAAELLRLFPVEVRVRKQACYYDSFRLWDHPCCCCLIDGESIAVSLGNWLITCEWVHGGFSRQGSRHGYRSVLACCQEYLCGVCGVCVVLLAVCVVCCVCRLCFGRLSSGESCICSCTKASVGVAANFNCHF